MVGDALASDAASTSPFGRPVVFRGTNGPGSCLSSLWQK